ncbi:MAG: ABC transporter ATP-binding protein [Termitinemataceae bacterium]|nr:MAG: ABC transporter ATP-binding protein [Termitinemataceae bacterium]
MDCAAIKLTNICKSFGIENGRFHALSDINLEIEKNSLTVISGENGSGKTVLMSIIANLEVQSSGSIEVNQNVGLVFQEADSQIIGETAREDIAIGIRAQKKSKQEAALITSTVLKNTGLTDKADFPARFLSGGEKRRLALAGVLAMNSGIIIFDEPYANLDYGGVRQVNFLIKELRASAKKTIIILTHELEKCLGFADKFVVLHKGRIVFCGSAEEGLKKDLAVWGIHHPLNIAKTKEELIWL